MRNALRRLWRLATCTHRNQCVDYDLGNTVRIRICRGCGRVVGQETEHDLKHNPHLTTTD